MARKRTLSPGFFIHGQLFDAEAACRLPLRLAFAALWCHADRRGVFEWKPRELKLVCLPYDAVDFGAVLSALEAAGFVASYTVQGRRYGVIPTFTRWQSFHRDERPSDAPDPSSADAVSAADADSAPGQHGASTVPPPHQHGATTAPNGRLSVTASVTTTATAAVVDVGYAEALARDALLLTNAANAGISVRYGEQPNPIHHGHKGGIPCAEALRAAGVDLEFAHAVIFAYASSLTAEKPPRSLGYFTEHVIERWKSELAKREAASYVPSSQPSPEVDQMRTFAIRYAQQGSAEWQQYCDERDIPWRAAS